MFDVNKYFWDEPYLFWEFVYHVIKSCVPEEEAIGILHAYHASPVGVTIVVFAPPLKFSRVYITYHPSIRIHMNLQWNDVNISSNVKCLEHINYLTPILEVELFDV